MKKTIFILFFLCFLFQISEVSAQRKRWRPPHKQKWTWNKFRQGYQSIGFAVNAMNYFGDITPLQGFYSTDVRFTRANFSIFYMKRFSPSFTGRAMFSYGRLAGADTITTNPKDGDDQFRYIRNLHFRNDIWELSLTGVVDLVSHREVFYDRPTKVIPYLVFGIAGFYHNPQAQTPAALGGDWVDLRPLGTEGQNIAGNPYGTPYSKWQVAFPLGIGFRKRIAQRWDLSFEVCARVLITDYLDDVSKNYVDLGVFENETAKAMHDRSRENGRQEYLRGGVTAFVPSDFTYIGKDGRRYTTFVGFGNDYYPDNIRGNVRDRDFYTITGIHLSYILPGQVRCPETFRARKGKYTSFFGQKGGMR